MESFFTCDRRETRDRLLNRVDGAEVDVTFVIKQLSTTDRQGATAFWQAFVNRAAAAKVSESSDDSNADGEESNGDPERAQSEHELVGPDDASLDMRLSLIALQEGEPVGLTLCHRDESGGCSHRMTIAVDGDHAELVRGLIDKSLAKLTARHVRKCRLLLSGGEPPRELWQQAAWVFDDSNESPIANVESDASGISDTIGANSQDVATDADAIVDDNTDAALAAADKA